MGIPHFIFTRYPNSFSVHVKNLEKLSVEQIKEIESFTRERKGVFDFDTYTFAIQKKLEFDEFTKLLEFCDIKAECENNILLKKTDAKIEFGKYKGMKYSEIPDTYLVWLSKNYMGQDRKIIEIELKSRNL